MSLRELDIIWKDNIRLKRRVDSIKNYILETKLSNGELIDLHHLVSYTKIPENQLIPILKIGIDSGLFIPMYKYYCTNIKIGQTEDYKTVEEFCDVCCKNHEFKKEEMKLGYKILFLTGAESIIDITEINNLNDYQIGIITALPHEFEAFKVLLENRKEIKVQGTGAGRRYILGEISSKSKGKHFVVLALADMGNNTAAIRATLLLEHFKSVKSIIMVGIAGGVPNVENIEEHVRLGDIVVSNQGGVIQYDFDKETISITEIRSSPRPPSASLFEAVRFLQVSEFGGNKPWINHINEAKNKLNIIRPSNETDILMSTNNPDNEISHPDDPDRVNDQPKIFLGTIAAANKLLKNPLKRDQLRDVYRVKAIEMESSGIADATWYHEVGYLVVRGICDYCDEKKNNVWQKYAAITAAAYTKSLLESM
jgi:nucleoside phosphorylase